MTKELIAKAIVYTMGAFFGIGTLYLYGWGLYRWLQSRQKKS